MYLHLQIGLIVIDSVAFHFRGGFSDHGLNQRLLQRFAQDLNTLGREYNLAVCALKYPGRFSDCFVCVIHILIREICVCSFQSGCFHESGHK